MSQADYTKDHQAQMDAEAHKALQDNRDLDREAEAQYQAYLEAAEAAFIRRLDYDAEIEEEYV